MTNTAAPPEIDAPPTPTDLVQDAVGAVVQAATAWMNLDTSGPADDVLAVRDLAAAVKALDKIVSGKGGIKETADAELLAWMADNAVGALKQAATGRGVHVRHDVRASIPACLRPAAVDALREIGAGDLVDETVNARTLSAWVRERLEDARTDGRLKEGDDLNLALPERVRDYVNVAEIPAIGTSSPRG